MHRMAIVPIIKNLIGDIMNKATLTLKSFIENSHVPATLIRAIVSGNGGWDEFKERASDIANHGSQSGCGGFIYYTDTVAFTAKYRPLIAEFAEDQAKELGYNSTITMIQDFNTIKDCGFSYNDIAKALYGRLSNNDTDQRYIKEQVYNVLCWYIEEEVSRSFVDYVYQLENDY
jgi:hypothetical protein